MVWGTCATLIFWDTYEYSNLPQIYMKVNGGEISID